jgi:STE24 endopeptidase
MIVSICLLIALSFLLKLIVNVLNLSCLGRQMPQEFATLWDEEKYRRSQEYLKENTILDLFESLVFSALMIAFLGGGYLLAADHFVRSFGLGETGTGILFFVFLILALRLIALPFSLYTTFVIEEKFGFNRTTALTFWKDFLIEIALSLVIFSILIGSILFLFNRYGPSAWLVCFALFCAYSLFLNYIAPNWIMPLFNRFTPLSEGPLKEAVLEYLNKQKFPISGIYSIDGSKRSNKANAFFTGLGRAKRVALFDTLIANYSIPEVIAILAHEVGHSKKNHYPISLAFSLIGSAIIFFLFSRFVVFAPSYYLGAFLFFAAFSALAWIPTALMLALSRKHEYEADAFAKETADGKAMVSALLKLSADNLTNLTPHPLMVLLSYSHPPVIDRIRSLKT